MAENNQIPPIQQDFDKLKLLSVIFYKNEDGPAGVNIYNAEKEEAIPILKEALARLEANEILINKII